MSRDPLIERNAPLVAEGDLVISDDDSIRAVCWYLKRDDVYNLGAPGELRYGFEYPEAGAGKRLIDLKAAAELIKQHRGHAVLIARVRAPEALARWVAASAFSGFQW